ncbi:hypothetical protein AMTRI_Chr03g140310 [Amborella trichopoda]|uniref:Uncharacterized protein n=1 Tax=Amborella trichopoda TaxID=13333 RepID=U5DDQ9_AMBTC|nr:uncharacterized protein LOC18448790 [Amborella trichopoda]ERN20370.1 hypothetical protein AMTR_s00068p00027090 [Amborella trichopoda]|eukprot:XP_006858903.3 uncharacterized protein LOC18448790 [Amborella trichopoda]
MTERREMASICSSFPSHLKPLPKPNFNDGKKKKMQGPFLCSLGEKEEAPQLLKLAVNGVTELLRLFSPQNTGLKSVNYTRGDEVSVYGVNDVLGILQSDFEKSYFVTGNMTVAIYAENCTFEDPTIRFHGRDLYKRNLELLVPFFDEPSLILHNIEKAVGCETGRIVASWKLRTYLKLPWRPLVSVEGMTVYDLNDDFKIVKHAESWNISALDAIAQLFTSSGYQKDVDPKHI